MFDQMANCLHRFLSTGKGPVQIVTTTEIGNGQLIVDPCIFAYHREAYSHVHGYFCAMSEFLAVWYIDLTNGIETFVIGSVYDTVTVRFVS